MKLFVIIASHFMPVKEQIALSFRIFSLLSHYRKSEAASLSDCIRTVPKFFGCFVYQQRDFSVMEKSGSSATDGALRPARHLSENASKHPEKSGTSESNPAVKQLPAYCNGKHWYKMRKLKINFLNRHSSGYHTFVF